MVLASRTLQSLARLHFDLAPLLAVDHRIRLVYTLSEGSDRRRFAEQRAKALGISLCPWKIAVEQRPDLVVSASATPELYESGAPVVLLPHGATYNRVLEGLSGAAGTAREQVLGPGGQVPALMAMPGAAAFDQLASDCPEALRSAELTGDLCMERLRISAPLRRIYREALGIEAHQKLVVVSSTWGPYSLSATDRSLPAHLLSRLPADEFALAFIPHPNLDADHGGNLLAYLRPLLHNGLIMVPPAEGWRAALIAADCVVGDAGSVTFYAANLHKPVLLAAFGFDEMAPGSPQSAFGEAAAWLHRDADPAAQLRTAIADGPHAGSGADRPSYLTEAWFEDGPGPASRITARLYELLGLPPAEPAPDLLAPPERLPESEPMSAWHCEVSLAPRDGGAVAACARYPAAAPVSAVAPDTAHLVVDESCLVQALRSDAEIVLFHRTARSATDSASLAAEALESHPRCALVSVRTGPGEAIVHGRDGRRFTVRCEGESLAVVPSVLHAGASDGTVRLRRGRVQVEAVIARR